MRVIQKNLALIFLFFISTTASFAAENSSGGGSISSGLSKIFPAPMLTISYGHDALWTVKEPGVGLTLDKGWDLHGSFDFTIYSPLHLIVGYYHTSQTGTADFDWTEYNTGLH